MRRLIQRRIFVGLLIVLQLVFLLYTVLSTSGRYRIINWFLSAISLGVALYIISRREKAAYRMTWIFQILVFPLFGGLFYLLFRFQSSTRRFRKGLARVSKRVKPLRQKSEDSLPKVPERYQPLARYLQNYADFPVYEGNRTRYLTPGEEMWHCLLEQLQKAERYIFLEYFILAEGEMWDSVLGILKKKAAQGVEVRLIYDDLGCFLLLPQNYPETLEKMGIHCCVFNPFRPILSALQNNRDHRKIAVIDGKAAITGGINLADEYINAFDKYGHWKDAAILVEGEAAWSMAVMFLEMWSFCRKTTEDLERFRPIPERVGDELIQPYADSPLDSENVGEHVYLHIINSAKDYLYINSPYLIVDDSMVSALILAAKSGVDVRIVTPHRWDKRLVHITTRSYYRELVKGGVRVYEYSKGFLHSKTFVSDDAIATVGTTNMDFRSLYLHFECGVCVYDTPTVAAVKEDYLKTLENCQEMTPELCQCGRLTRLFQDILRLFAPLM
ncbi:cardiolipin synthase [Angelakisella massiliensis]|uniref:cardiolipin synthase n=1 Tax=Angelakisella massiliensis TaxID=1871018 RepID=UPI0024B26F88|nr:cardiolipin synthase [Angelakisella massiliensis]